MNLNLPADFGIYAQWSGILTLVCLGLAIIAAIARWGFRFRLVGVTGFMAVLTIGLFGLSLGLAPRSLLPDALRYKVTYDNGADQIVIVVPNQVTPTQVEATLRQAAADLYSPGRIGPSGELSIRVRTIIHPQTGVSQPLYLGEVKRSLGQRVDENMNIAVFSEEFAQLPQ
ncbi:Ycf51 family protein [Gloeocapsa sp. PCC 73106]|uniref:Ycf51 family protein n=1 Tax=Gloeocapsa sp. PCC 73106 TaxID=102232 RepID=UPI0002AC1A2C|nr:Ycf51 family protein [Gloeocapsa sp. PCC 73106]ELR99108.1 Protein of function (DUF2518) [Gloeocapsa sp. PCC 73106]